MEIGNGKVWNARWKPVTMFLFLLVLIGLVAVTAGFLPPSDSITREHYDHIRLGMTLSEVEALLGSPGIGVHQVKRVAPNRKTVEMAEEGPFDNRPDDNEPGRRLLWISRDSSVMIRLGQDNRVTDKMFLRLAPLTVYQRVHYFWFKN